MPNATAEPSFDDIAVALSLAATKFKLDLEQMELLAARVGISQMGTSLACSELQRNLDIIAHAHNFFKDGAAAEREVRAVVDRKKRGRWAMFTRTAAL
jgi:hypothetical protein